MLAAVAAVYSFVGLVAWLQPAAAQCDAAAGGTTLAGVGPQAFAGGGLAAGGAGVDALNSAGQAMAVVQMAQQAALMRQAMRLRLRASRPLRQPFEAPADITESRKERERPESETVGRERITNRDRLIARLKQRAEQRRQRRLARWRDRK